MTIEPRPPVRSSRLLGALRAAPQAAMGATALVRLTASTTMRGTTRAARGAASTVTDVVRGLGAGEPVLEIIEHQVETVRWGARQVLGLEGPAGGAERRGSGASAEDLRARGDRLLRRSATDAGSQSEHPAFSHILDDLVPDEARVLRFMAVAGPQPSIDVRTKTPFGVGSERVAGGINMIAAMAGCTYPDRGNEYLANLNRLGLVLFSAEPVEDPRRYSFIEAQPETSEAIARAKKAHTVYRSILISGFGRHFCDVCFTLDGYDAGGWIRDVR